MIALVQILRGNHTKFPVKRLATAWSLIALKAVQCQWPCNTWMMDQSDCQKGVGIATAATMTGYLCACLPHHLGQKTDAVPILQNDLIFDYGRGTYCLWTLLREI